MGRIRGGVIVAAAIAALFVISGVRPMLPLSAQIVPTQAQAPAVVTVASPLVTIGGLPTFVSAGTNVFSLSGPTGAIMASGQAYAWSSTTSSTGSVDTQITRVGAGEISIGSTAVTFATLGTPANGAIAYCTDCTEVTPASCPATQASCVCAGSGTGAFARRVAAAWYCTF